MWLRMYPSWTKACWKKCVSSSLHPHFVVYPNTLPPDWLNWCNKFWINASHFWRHKFKALVFSTGVMALSLSKKKDTIFFLFWICELFQSVKSYQWPKTLRFLYLSFFSWILVAKKPPPKWPPPTNRFFYVHVCGFCYYDTIIICICKVYLCNSFLFRCLLYWIHGQLFQQS